MAESNITNLNKAQKLGTMSITGDLSDEYALSMDQSSLAILAKIDFSGLINITSTNNLGVSVDISKQFKKHQVDSYKFSFTEYNFANKNNYGVFSCIATEDLNLYAKTSMAFEVKDLNVSKNTDKSIIAAIGAGSMAAMNVVSMGHMFTKGKTLDAGGWSLGVISSAALPAMIAVGLLIYLKKGNSSGAGPTSAVSSFSPPKGICIHAQNNIMAKANNINLISGEEVFGSDASGIKLSDKKITCYCSSNNNENIELSVGTTSDIKIAKNSIEIKNNNSSMTFTKQKLKIKVDSFSLTFSKDDLNICNNFKFNIKGESLQINNAKYTKDKAIL